MLKTAFSASAMACEVLTVFLICALNVSLGEKEKTGKPGTRK